MKIKPAVIVTMTDGVPNCHSCGDIGAIHQEFRSLKKHREQPFDEAYRLDARGIQTAKFNRVAPEQPKPKAKTRTRKAS